MAIAWECFPLAGFRNVWWKTWLSGYWQPDFRTIADFRKLHLQALEALFQQVLRLVLEVGARKLGRVALDGSKVKANASKHKAMSYGRMGETEKRLREEVRRLLKQAEATDEEEDRRYGRERQGEELPEELQRRETRIARIQEAKKALEEPYLGSFAPRNDPQTSILGRAPSVASGSRPQVSGERVLPL